MFYRDFHHNERFPSDYTRALEEYVGTHSNLSLVPVNSTTIGVSADAENGMASLGLKGLWRFNIAQVLASHPGGAAGTYDVVAATGPNSFTPGTPEGEEDNTNYSWSLHIEETGKVPSGGGIAATRKIGEVDWDGTKLTGLRQLVPGLTSTSTLAPTQAVASVSPLKVKGIASPTAALAVIAGADATGTALEVTAEGNAKLRVSMEGVLSWPGGGPSVGFSGGALAVTGNLSVSGTTTLTGGGTSTTAAEGDNTTKIATTAFVHTAVATLSGEVVAALALKAPLASPALTGTPTAPTAAEATNTTQIATTAFVQTLNTKEKTRAETAEALLAPKASPALTGVPTAPTAAVNTNTTQIATTAFVVGQASAVQPLMDGAEAIGVSLRYARADHVHPIDTSRAPVASPTFTGTASVPTLDVTGAGTALLVSNNATIEGTLLVNGATKTTSSVTIERAEGATALQTWVSGVSTINPFVIDTLGKQRWGEPKGALDTTLERSAAGVLKVTGTLQASKALAGEASASTNNATSTVGVANVMQAPQNTVSLFVGYGGNASAFTATEYSGAIRFGGSTVNWGDFAYFPKDAGTNGHFRLYADPSAVGTGVATAGLGVGALFVQGAFAHRGGLFGVFNTAPAAQSAGWGTPSPPGGANKTVLTYESTLKNVIDAFETLKLALTGYGILGA